jgi:hypothetical protein
MQGLRPSASFVARGAQQRLRQRCNPHCDTGPVKETTGSVSEAQKWSAAEPNCRGDKIVQHQHRCGDLKCAHMRAHFILLSIAGSAIARIATTLCAVMCAHQHDGFDGGTAGSKQLYCSG